MPSYRHWMFAAAIAAAAAGPGAREAAADSTKDELAEGDWRGEQDWKSLVGGGAGTVSPVPGTTGPAPAGTPTPAPAGGSPAAGGTATEPTGPAGPAEPGGPSTAGPSPTGTGSAPSAPVPVPPPPTVPGPTPVPATCNARWVVEVEEATPSLHEEQTLLTITLFRTDAFAFVSNGYCRSESTWFVDAFAGTQAGHDGSSNWRVELRIEHPCPDCRPKIDLKGISQIEARAQAKTPWGSLSGSTTASAGASTLWAGDIDCGDRCTAAVVNADGTGEIEVGAEPLKITRSTGRSYVLVEAEGGKGDSKHLDAPITSLRLLDRGSVRTYADGTDDNAQAKCRVGYILEMRGQSACGAWGEYRVNLRE